MIQLRLHLEKPLKRFPFTLAEVAHRAEARCE